MEKETFEIHELGKLALELAEKIGVDQAILQVNRSKRRQIRFAKSQIVVSKQWWDYSLGVFLVKDKKLLGTAIKNLQSREAIEKAFDEFKSLLNVMKPNQDFHGIAEGPFSYPTVESLYDKKVAALGEEAVELVGTAIQAAKEKGAPMSAGVLYFGENQQYLLTNTNIEGEYQTTAIEFSIRSFVDSHSSGQSVAVGRRFDSVNFEKVGEEAAEIATKSVKAKKGESGVYSAILSPIVAADIIAATARAANPFSIEAGFSWLKDKLGQQIAAECYTIKDNGIYPNGLGSAPFDEEGVPHQETTLIEQGVLKSLIHNTSTARKYDTKSTGNAGLVSPENTNIVFQPGDYSFDELLAEAPSPAIYVTSNWYTRFTSYIEGIFSTIPRDGMFLIKNGEIAEPIRELRISDKMLDLMKNTIALSKEVRQIRWWEVEVPTFVPHVLIKDVHFTTGTK